MKIKKTVHVNKMATADLAQENDEAIQVIAGEEVKVMLTQERYQELLASEARANAKPKTPQEELKELFSHGKKLYAQFKPEVDSALKDFASVFQDVRTERPNPEGPKAETPKEDNPTGSAEGGKEGPKSTPRRGRKQE